MDIVTFRPGKLSTSFLINVDTKKVHLEPITEEEYLKVCLINQHLTGCSSRAFMSQLEQQFDAGQYEFKVRTLWYSDAL